MHDVASTMPYWYYFAPSEMCSAFGECFFSHHTLFKELWKKVQCQFQQMMHNTFEFRYVFAKLYQVTFWERDFISHSALIQTCRTQPVLNITFYCLCNIPVILLKPSLTSFNFNLYIKFEGCPGLSNVTFASCFLHLIDDCVFTVFDKP